jgi:Flp pilus assembly protein TadD
VLDAGAADYREYLEIRRAFNHRRGAAPTGALLDQLDAVRRRSPHFLDATLLAAEMLRYRFRDHRDAADLERAFDLLAAARRLAPADPYPLAADFSLALDAERLDRAAEDLAVLARVQPGDPAVLSKRAQLLERRGATAPALALLREACRRRSSWANLMMLADMEYRLGEGAAARRHLEQLLRRAPGFDQAQSLLAQSELLSGSPARAAELYADLLRRSPQETEIINLGTAYMLLRRYPEAEARFRQALALAPDNPFVTLNLADVCLLEGRQADAMDLYRRLLVLTAKDPAATHWQLLSVRAQALARLGQSLPAVAAAQSVLALAPRNAQAEAEVAVVYAVIGDRVSALWNAEQALRQGVDPRWFSFPWFDTLRTSPELRPLLTGGAPPA